jgi:murein DD-endopeptidase MepM/ murein hydrolase activator NlpD
LRSLGIVVLGGCVYGFYGLTQQAMHLRIENENRELRAENERQQQELNRLSNRVEAVEDTSRKLAEKSGVVAANNTTPGAGGPELPLDLESVRVLETKMSQLERDLHAYEAVMGDGYTPTVWPVEGKLESGFGGRRNPFGGSSYEFHSGQDIDAPWGAPVVAGASGKVTFVGWQNGYGQLVVIDHGEGIDHALRTPICDCGYARSGNQSWRASWPCRIHGRSTGRTSITRYASTMSQ